MKKFLSLLTVLTLIAVPALSAQSGGRLKGRVVDVAGMPIPKVQIIIGGPAGSFEVVSNEDGYYEIEVAAGIYQINSEKLPGFAATSREGVRVGPGETVEVNIVPAVSSEGVLSSLPITDAPVKKQKKQKKRKKRRAT